VRPRTVENSPFAATASPAASPVCHAIAGMLEAMARRLWQRPAVAHETRCRAAARRRRLPFRRDAVERRDAAFVVSSQSP
jgi:hypothetical protein